jgi:hypothetical protein
VTLPTVAEVIRRVDQGMTRPYLCRADDGCEYFVKHGALPPSQRVAEWLASTVAKPLGLPIAPFSLIRIPEELNCAGAPWLRELGAGVGFGSQKQLAREFAVGDIDRVEPMLAAKIAAFDWWVRNSDRNLSNLGGNVNLLWQTGVDPAGLVVIDHNMAFDAKFSADEFLESHVFAAQFKELVGDFIDREQVRQELCAARRLLAGFWHTIPEGWRFSDPERTVTAGWRRQDFDDVLARCEIGDGFWNF